MYKETFRVTNDILATKEKRFLNFIIDFIIKMVIGIAIGVLIGIISALTDSYGLYNLFIESESRLMDYVFGIIITLIYYNIFETATSRSIGKYITKTKVVMVDGSKPKFDDILIRTLCRLIPFNAFSFLGDLGKGWHDTLSKTYVVDVVKFEQKHLASNNLEQIGQPVAF